MSIYGILKVGDFMKNLILIIKGFFIGIANIIPGVSGGTIALIVGVYERLIEAISHFTKNIKENIKFILPIGIGIAISVLTLSNVIDKSYKAYPFATTLFFIGLVLGGIPFGYKKIKEKTKISNWIIFLITFSLVISMSLLGNTETFSTVSLDNLNLLGYIKLLLVGILASATMIIPGVSGSLVLMLIGYYYPIISVLKDLTKFNNLSSNLLIVIVFGIGVLIGVIVLAKIIEMLFNKYENKTYYGVLGFICASVFAIPISTFMKITYVFIPLEFIVGIILLILGFFISIKLGDK